MGMGEKLHGTAQPLVSIIMLAYNGLPYIKEAVNCIINQTYKNWELIIADDGSSDGTREWLEESYGKDKRIRFFFHKNNMGYVANKNFAHKQAIGEYITQLDNDDVCSYDRIQKQVDVVLQNPSIKLVGCGYYCIGFDGKIHSSKALTDNILFDKRPVEGYPFWFPSLLVHRDVFKDIGYFDPYFSGSLGDDIYWTVLANRKYQIFCLKDVLYGYRNNPNSITNGSFTERKLIMPIILERLFEQQFLTGSDYLIKKDLYSLMNLENKLTNDRKLMGIQYQIAAAKSIDKSDIKSAISLIRKSFSYNKYNCNLYRTIIYALRIQKNR